MSYRIFIASSSEGLRVAETVQVLLQEELGDPYKVLIWNEETFEPTKTYIESIEQELEKVDFAVLVMTQDDEQLYRKTKALVPRDNVVFELGLFIGKLGRERSFYIQPPGLKLPTDLLGIESLKFNPPERTSGEAAAGKHRNSLSGLPRQERDALRAALRPACSKVGAAISRVIKNEPSRQRLTDKERTLQRDRRRFFDQIGGAWWERIRFNGKVQALSFFTVRADEAYNSVRLDGQAYGKDGALRAEWRSAAARLEDGKIVYVRECSHYSPGTKPKWRPGLGEFNFVPTADGRIEKGSGTFWEGDEDDPAKTIIKSVELRRAGDANHKAVMEDGSERAKATLVRSILDPAQSPVF